MKQKKGSNQIAVTAKKLSRMSTVILMVALLLFLVVTMSGMYQLNSKIKLTTEHPFVVSRHVGVIRTDVAQMRIRTERLQSYRMPVDIERVNDALNELYADVKIPMEEIQRLYLGPREDADLIADTLDEIKAHQMELLDFASVPTRTREEISSFEEQHLYPLYEKIEAGAGTILAYTQNTQMTVYAFSKSLWKSTLLWSIVIAMITMAGFILFQYLLGRVNRELYAKNQQFNTLSHTIDETFLVFDASSPLSDFVADNAMRVIGISAQSLRQDREQFYAHMDEGTKLEIKSTLNEINSSYSKDLSVLYRNPHTLEEQWLLMRFYKTGEEAGSKNIVSISDQTADVRAHQNLKDALSYAENANNARRDFLSRMSHEIRTPMNAIIGMTTIAGASIDSRSRVEDCLAKIGYASKHLLMLINDILDMSKIESNKLAINNEPFEIYQFVNTFIAVFYGQAKDRGIQFSEKISGFSAETSYIGDAMRLNQILLNLVSNAVKFTEPGGSVLLEVKRIPSADKEEYIRFTVKDTGIGMTEDALQRLYEPFDQADAAIAQKYGGTGLGMSITKNLVSLMGGYINVQSQPNQGTTCIVEIPFEKSSEELEALPSENLKALHILVVDDELDMCEHTTLLLAKINIRSQWVLNGEEAVALVESAREQGTPFDICIIDWQMPDMDGIETARRIRQRIGPGTPIIIISAYDWSDIEVDARAAGVDAFIAKPLFLSSVYNVLVNVTNGAFARTAKQEPNSIMALKNRRILIAEDNELNLEIAEAMLQMNGAAVECVGNGKEAVDKFLEMESGYYDAILMDIQMPIMNGYEATQRIRMLDHPDAKKIPIIATTANAFAEDVREALAFGMNAHISKPIDAKVLCDVLAKWM